MTHLLLAMDSEEFKPQQLQTLKDSGYTIKTIDEFDQKTEMDWPEVIVGRNQLDLKKPELFTRLKLIQLTSAGYNKVNVEKATEVGIKVANARGAYSVQIAEYILAKILAVYKNQRLYDSFQIEKEWNRKLHMTSLVGQEVAILGTGSIGQAVAKRLRPFETIITGFNTIGRLDPNFDDAHALSELSEIIHKFDIIVICLPLNDATDQLFDKNLLLKTKETATLINIGRGKIIKEDDLIDILDAHLRAVILDVFEKEPLPQDSPLWSHPKAYVSAHISFNDDSTTETLHTILMDNLIRYIEKEPLNNLIN